MSRKSRKAKKRQLKRNEEKKAYEQLHQGDAGTSGDGPGWLRHSEYLSAGSAFNHTPKTKRGKSLPFYKKEKAGKAFASGSGVNSI